MSDSVMSALAELVVKPSSASMPTSSVDAAKRLVLDSLGVAIAAHDQPGVAQARQLVADWGGRAEASVWLADERVPTPHAAFVNSIMVHALDFDDKNYAAGMHAMSTVLPVAIALAEVNQSSGADLLAAIIVGVEVATLLGTELMTAGIDRGFLPTSIIGGFGATAAAARLMGLSLEQAQDALGLWYCQAAGNRQALVDRSMGKRLQPAFTARSAVWSSELARLGLTGPRGAIDGDCGLFQLYGRSEPPKPALFTAPTRGWAIESYWIKQYPSCGGAHRPTEAAIRLATDADLDPKSITNVVVEVGESSGWHLGKPFEIRSDPQVDAQFSIPYAVALGLVRRRASLAEYQTARIRQDIDVLNMSRLVDVRVLPDTKHLTSDQVPATVTAHLDDGRVLSRTVQSLRGSPDNPMTIDEVINKFEVCCEFADAFSPETVAAIVNEVLRLDEVASIEALIKRLTATRKRQS